MRLFERIIPNSVGSTEADYLEIVREFPPCGLVFFFEENDDVFAIESFHEFFTIYSQCALFTVYVTNPKLEFMVCWTDEQTLVVSGAAEEWL